MRMGINMKGQAYEFILIFIGIFISIMFWVVFNHAIIDVGDTLYGLVDLQEHHDIINMQQAIFYYFLFFIILISFIYVVKVSLERGDRG